MLLEISIKNFAIIEAISLNFERVWLFWPGETGAGKVYHYRRYDSCWGLVQRQMLFVTVRQKQRLRGLFLSWK